MKNKYEDIFCLGNFQFDWHWFSIFVIFLTQSEKKIHGVMQ